LSERDEEELSLLRLLSLRLDWLPERDLLLLLLLEEDERFLPD
jgi:hypothetical protein